MTTLSGGRSGGVLPDGRIVIANEDPAEVRVYAPDGTGESRAGVRSFRCRMPIVRPAGEAPFFTPPPVDRVLDVGPGYALTVRSDELDVEFVELWRLEREVRRPEASGAR